LSYIDHRGGDGRRREVVKMTTAMTNVNEAFTVTRRLAVRGITADDRGRALVARLTALDGVLDAVLEQDRRKVRVRYNAGRVGYGELEAVLADAGVLDTTRRWQRFVASWYRYLDTNARDNANAPPAACCSNPRGIYAQQKVRGTSGEGRGKR
jgi:hypothetical protein